MVKGGIFDFGQYHFFLEVSCLADENPGGLCHGFYHQALGHDLESREMVPWQAGATDGRISPDGRWAAYASAESGTVEIYVERFPDRGERFQVSNGAAGWPVWHREGKEIYYVSTAGDLMAVPVDMNASSDPVGRPIKLFRPRLTGNYFDIGPDNQRFLIAQRVDPEISSIVLIQNWVALPRQ